MKTAQVITHKGGHWSIALVLEEGGNPPRVNMTLNQEDLEGPGVMDWNPHNGHGQPWFCIRAWDYALMDNVKVKVKGIYELVREQGFHQ